MRYYKDLIVDAQYEVILATNYWEPSWGAHLSVPHAFFSNTLSDGGLLAYTMLLLSSLSVRRGALRNLWSR